MDAVTHRRRIVGLADRLVADFAGTGTMSAGQVLRVVHRADYLVVHTAVASQDAIALCEAIARRVITERVAQLRRPDTAATSRRRSSTARRPAIPRPTIHEV